MNVHDYIKQVRKSLGLTQTEFAEQLQTTQANVSKWERGETMPSAELLWRVQGMDQEKS